MTMLSEFASLGSVSLGMPAPAPTLLPPTAKSRGDLETSAQEGTGCVVGSVWQDLTCQTRVIT